MQPKLRRRYCALVSVSLLALGACTQRASEEVRATATAAILSASTASPQVVIPTADTATLAADLRRVVTNVDPILLPTTLPTTFLPTIEALASDGFSVVFVHPATQQKLLVAVMQSNPPPPTGQTEQTMLSFRDARALYQVQDRREPTSDRFVVWDEPGQWTTAQAQRPSVTYYVAGQGMTDKEFWLYVQGLQPINPPATSSPAPTSPASGQSTGAPIPAATVTQPVALGDAKQAIIDAVDALKHAGPYRVYQHTMGASAQTDDMLEAIPPDRWRAVLADGVEMIVIGARRWSKIGAVWTEQPSDGALPSIGLGPEQMAGGLLDNAQALGGQDLGGTTANLYRAEATSDISGVLASHTLIVWVGSDTGLPLRVDSHVEVEGVTTTMTMTYEYSHAIEIEPPLE
jgi:hypothetical protein